MRRLWETRSGRLSHQVLQEFYVTVTRKLKPALPPFPGSRRGRGSPRLQTGAILKSAWHLEDRYGLSWWDSLIAAAALAQACATLMT